MVNINFNERSHAIDLITEINMYLQNCNLLFKKAGGEATLKNSKEIDGKKRKILFPDLMLYEDKEKNIIMQGWEIKLPDVDVTDSEFIADALYKAEVMNLNSTLLWNFKDVVLYAKVEGKWKIMKVWSDLNKIKNRADVDTYRHTWIDFLKNKLLIELNQFFINGNIKSKTIADVTDNITIHLINNYKGILAEHLKENSKTNIKINAYIKKWWKQAENEFMSDETNSYNAYAKTLILSWITRLSFCHIISDKHFTARQIKNVEPTISPKEMNKLFENITKESDFYTIFKNQILDEHLPKSLWIALLDFNAFLFDKTLSHKSLQNMLELTVNRYKREIVGQFTTPEKLARLLVRMTIKNLDSSIIDPCCGSATIPKQVQEYMMELNFGIEKIHSNIWSSDKLSMPLQITNLTLTSSKSMNQINKVFQYNVLSLLPNKEIQFISPIDGSELLFKLPKFSNIVSNLPFVPSKIIDEEDKKRIDEIKNKIYVESDNNINISKKSDYYYYIILHLSELINDNGRIGIILSNSWLGTDSGKILYAALNYYFDIDTVVISGKGKWFENADVMSSILILNNKKNPTDSIKFLKLDFPLKQLSYKNIDEIANDYILDAPSKYYTQSSYSKEEITLLQNKNISLNSLFFDISWLKELNNCLISLSSVFKVIRGMRRGWDPLFYLPSNHNIEQDYVEPVIMSSKNIKHYSAKPDGDAFCCSRTIEELRSLNHDGALNWINKFEKSVNNVGKPLQESLRKKNHQWYEMKTDNSLAELITSINPGKRIFWSSLDKPSFINQRLIGLNKKDNCFASTSLLLVLLNSIIGLFFIESIGFGRGLGALDIQKSNIEKSFMLNPEILTENQKNEILLAFNRLNNNISNDTRDDLFNKDRENFDKLVLKCYGVEHLYSQIRESLISMINTRLDARS